MNEPLPKRGDNEEDMMKIHYGLFQKIAAIFEKLESLPKNYGEKYSYKLVDKGYRKNEYTYHIDLECDLGGNMVLMDTVIIWFNDYEKNEVEEHVFEKAVEDIENFVAKVNKIKDK
jgi:hypothetical protein